METAEMTIQVSMSTAIFRNNEHKVLCKKKTITPSSNNKKQTNGIILTCTCINCEYLTILNDSSICYSNN